MKSGDSVGISGRNEGYLIVWPRSPHPHLAVHEHGRMSLRVFSPASLRYAGINFQCSGKRMGGFHPGSVG